MEDDTAEYRSYLLRFWRTASGGVWRASLEDPRTGERLGFSSIEALINFLRRQTELKPAPNHDTVSTDTNVP